MKNESIKVRSWNQGGFFTNKWNSDLGHKDEYVHVCIHLNTHFVLPVAEVNWFDKARTILASFNILERTEDGKTEPPKHAYLFLHPSIVVGIIKATDVEKVAEAFQAIKNTSVQSVDTFDTSYLVTDEEYEQYLSSRDDDIRTHLMFACCPNDEESAFFVHDLSKNVAARFYLKRVGTPDELETGSGQTIDHIEKMIDSLIQEGLLIVTTSEDGRKMVYRSDMEDPKGQKVAFLNPYVYENCEGDKGIIMAINYDDAVAIYHEKYPNRVLLDLEDDLYAQGNRGAYLYELDLSDVFETDRGNLYNIFPH